MQQADLLPFLRSGVDNDSHIRTICQERDRILTAYMGASVTAHTAPQKATDNVEHSA